MDSQLDNQEALLQLQEEDDEQQHELELQNERQGFLIIPNIIQLKSFEILKSAAKNLTSDTKFMLFMILSVLPVFTSIVFLEIKITVVKDAILHLLAPASTYVSYIYNFEDTPVLDDIIYDENDIRRKIFHIILDLFPFYLVLLPLIELFSFTIIINFAAKMYSGEVESTTLHEIFYQKNKLKGPLITSLWVQLFSTSTLFGLLWAVINHFIITNGFNFSGYFVINSHHVVLEGLIVNILSIVFHAAMFLGILSRYLDWSVFWNMGIVISVIEEESGTDALEISAYYGRHSKQTGFELMLVFFAYSVALRLPFALARMFGFVSFGVAEIVIIAGLVCLGSLVKWVVFVLYYYECKAQVLMKKVDEELGVGEVHCDR